MPHCSRHAAQRRLPTVLPIDLLRLGKDSDDATHLAHASAVARLPLIGLTLAYLPVDTRALNSDFTSKTGKVRMSPTESPPDLPTQSESQLPASRPSLSSAASDETEAVIAALDEAEVAFDADEEQGRLLDNTSDALEILDADPILSEDEPLAGAPDPIDLVTRRAKNETARDRIAFFEQEAAHEDRPAQQAVLQHEIAVQLEQSGNDDADVSRAYTSAQASDAGFRPNLWALRRLFARRSQWPSVLKLLDIEARYAPTKRERAEVWTEKGHILEDLLTEIEEAIICYRTAHELDPQALAPLAALEKLLVQRSTETGRPSAELLTVYRGLTSATHDPSRRVALLIELARYEEDVLQLDQPGHSGDLDRVLAYLHEAYDVGIDQMRVIDEIVRLTASFGRIPDCLAALEVKAEILEMQAQHAPPQRQSLLLDQVVSVRRWQSVLARERLANTELAWQYLDKAYQRSPGDPLIMPDLMALAEAQGRHEQLAELLAQMEENHRLVHGDNPPPLGLWLKRAVALRLANQDATADELEQTIASYTPAHLLLLLGRQRRAMHQQDSVALAQLLRDEADTALQGLSAQPDTEKQSDPVWATDALLNAAACALRSGDLSRAEEALQAAQKAYESAAPKARPEAHQRLLHDAHEELYIRSGKRDALFALYEERLANGLWKTQPLEAQRLHEALVDLCEIDSTKKARAAEILAPLLAALPEDIRLRRRAVQLARRSGDASREEGALREVEAHASKQQLGPPLFCDLLRRAELLAELGDSKAAVALYRQVLDLQPGNFQALDAVEQILRKDHQPTELAELLRQQIDACAKLQSGDAESQADILARRFGLQAALANLLENELAEPQQALAVYHSMLTVQPTYHPALRAIERLQRHSGNAAQQIQVLTQLGEALPSSSARAAVQVRLAEVLESSTPKSAEADEAFKRAFQSMPLPTPVAAHAALGRLRVLMRQRNYASLNEVLEAFDDTLLADEPLRLRTSVVLGEERAYWGAQSGTGVALERSEALLFKAVQDIRQNEGKALLDSELIPLLEWSRCHLAQQRGDGKQQGMALAAMTAYLEQQGENVAKTLLGELWLRAGLLGSLNEDEHSQQVEAAQRLLSAYRLLGDCPQVIVPLCDLLEDLSIAEPLSRQPEIISILRARQALCPDGDIEDRLSYTLLEAEIWLMRCESPDENTPLDDLTRARHAQEAAEAALRALALDPQNVLALLLLRQATAPIADESNSAETPVAPSDPLLARLQAYALYTLRLAGLLSQPEAKAELYNEAAQLLLRVGDVDAAAAALRTLLDSTPYDASAFGKLHSLLIARSEEPGRGDAGPLLELLDFRLSLKPESEMHRKSEQPLRVSLLLQRAALLRSSGQLSDAMVDMQELLSLDSQHALAHRRLAELLAQTGRPEDAIRHYEHFLQLDSNPAERSAVHIAVARLLSATTPSRAISHVRQAIDLGHKYRALRGEALETVEEVSLLADLYRWLEQLELSQGQVDAAVETLRELESHIPSGEAFAAQRQSLALEIAAVLYERRKDPPGAVAALEKLVSAEPLALRVLERLLELQQATHQPPDAMAAHYSRSTDEARRQITDLATSSQPLAAAPFLALKQIFGWQKLGDAQRLSAQAAAALGEAAEKPLLRKMPSKALGAPLRTAAFSNAARGVLYDLWCEISDTLTKLFAPDLKTLGSDAKERLNGKQVPQVWATVDELAQKFGMGSSEKPYGLYLSRERDLCQISGHNLICGSNYSSTLSDFPPVLYFRLLKKLALLPDRLGPVDGDLQELLLLFAACCQLAQISGPSLSSDLKSRLDERTKLLDRNLARKERNALRALAPRLHPLAGEEGREFVATWQKEVLLGSAQLALALSGNVAAALSELSIQPNDSNAPSAKMARRLLGFSVSAEILTLRRDLGVVSE